MSFQRRLSPLLSPFARAKLHSPSPGFVSSLGQSMRIPRTPSVAPTGACLCRQAKNKQRQMRSCSSSRVTALSSRCLLDVKRNSTHQGDLNTQAVPEALKAIPGWLAGLLLCLARPTTKFHSAGVML
ncbi:hypothetical protein FA13DRAFT_1010734 [Coprinellus micaceus]|uniref:Uncharacterized protein n=1 Tax=Coprinellus micaceus TaxID=71717 RepID=A0A4Y7SY10_COPMI|nr:hypothetical protein FA13DRAFT_1010734 [Coprinellus micaceus]